MNITLLGYGKMGQAIEREALARGHEIAFRIDQDNWEAVHELTPQNTDVVIEFTHPDAFKQNLKAVLGRGLPLVSGTTGWYDRLAEVKAEVEAVEGSFLYSANFSIGVNILFKLNRELARLMNTHVQYDCAIMERHHRHKVDAPSGTAVQLGQQILEGLDRKRRIATEALRERAPEADELSVGYIRSGEIIGEHEVLYQSEIDTLSIRHVAHNRQGFALGAVIGAEWLSGRKGSFEFREVFE